MTLGERLKLLRGERDWNRNHFAQIADISYSYLCDLERDRTLPTLVMLARIANLYQMSVASLLSPVTLPGELYPGCMPEPLPYDDIPAADENWMRENKVGSQYDPDYFVIDDTEGVDDDPGYDDPRYGGY